MVVKPEQYNLSTGENLGVNVPKSGHGCATYSLTEQAIFYRGGSVTQFNFDTREFSRWDRLRPDCWLSTIPAQGMVLSPEGGGGCSCGNWMETSMVLAPISRAPITIKTIGDIKPNYKEETYGTYTQRYQPNEFVDSLEVELVVKPGLKAEVFYTLNGDEPSKNSKQYNGVITINKSALLRVAVFIEVDSSVRKYERKRSFIRLRPMPHIIRQRVVSNGSIEVKFKRSGNTGNVFYTTDGSEPSSDSYSGIDPLIIDSKTIVKARTIWMDNGVAYLSDVVKKEVDVPEIVEAVEANVKRGISYEYYEGNWKEIPDFKKIKPKSKGGLDRINIQKRLREDNYGFRFMGYLNVPVDGVYTLSTSSDDGNYLFLHNELVIDNGGNHGVRERNADVALKAGLHPLTVLYYQGGGGQVFNFEIEGPELEKQNLPAAMLCH